MYILENMRPPQGGGGYHQMSFWGENVKRGNVKKGRKKEEKEN
jgi:hypothetical protein